MKTRAIILLVTLFMGMGAIGSVMCAHYLKRCALKRVAQRVDGDIASWEVVSLHVTAAVAEAEWASVRDRLGENLRFVPRKRMAEVQNRLGVKYFAEAQYGKAFDHYALAAEMMLEDEQSPFLIYVAALGQKKVWLRRVESHIGQDKDGIRLLFLRACLAWGDDDYKALLDMTAGGSWRAGAVNGSKTTDNWELWFGYLRAQAFVGRKEWMKAWKELTSPVHCDLETLRQSDMVPFLVEYVTLSAVVGERIGQYKEVLGWVNAARDRVKGDPCWMPRERWLKELAERLMRESVKGEGRPGQ